MQIPCDSREAKKRVLLKRYLAVHGVEFDVNWPTPVLRGLVLDLRRRHRHTSHASATREKVLQVAEENHYLKNLVALKALFGINASMGCVEGDGVVRCKTVADLIRIGWVPERFGYLDQHLHLVAS